MTYFGQQFGGAVHHGLEAVSHVTSTHQETEKDDCLCLAVFPFLFSLGLHRFMVSPILGSSHQLTQSQSSLMDPSLLGRSRFSQDTSQH